jgi:hypothetical protein
VTITAGDKSHGKGNDWSVPKKDLFGELQVLLEDRRLKVPRKLAQSGALVEELTNIRMWQKPGGRTTMGAEGTGEHDDLAMAVALACWRAQWKQIGFGNQRLPGI